MARWIHEAPLYRIGTERNLTICAWFDAPNLDSMRKFAGVVNAQRAAHPDGPGLLNIVLSGTPNFSKEVREEAARLSAEGDRDAGAAHVILLGGLRGVATRTFISTAILVGRSKSPTKVFDSFKPAAEWLAPLISRGGITWTPAELEAFEAATTKK
jgi:hypothetical protein